jgi:hypothetical protein
MGETPMPRWGLAVARTRHEPTQQDETHYNGQLTADN